MGNLLATSSLYIWKWYSKRNQLLYLCISQWEVIGNVRVCTAEYEISRFESVPALTSYKPLFFYLQNEKNNHSFQIGVE
jgi:hypothetical protein